jgi:hypothetical protein
MAHQKFPSSGELAAVFADIPPQIREFLSKGFKVLSQVKQESLSDLVSIAAMVFSSDMPSEREFTELGKRFGVNVNDIPELLGAVNLLLQAICARSEPPNQIVEAATHAGMMGPSEQSNAFRLANVAAENKPALKAEFEAENIAAAVLPSLSAFSVAIDLRLEFEGEGVRRSVPVAIVHIDTDTQNELWLQLSVSQVERVAQELSMVLTKLRLAEVYGKSTK